LDWGDLRSIIPARCGRSGCTHTSKFLVAAG